MPFADELMGVDVAARLLREISQAAPSASLETLRAAPALFPPLALGARAALLADALLHDLPGDYASFAAVIRTAAAGDGFSGWLIWPVTSAVAAKAVAEDTDESFDDALSLLAELTSRLTSEFAIRALLRHNLPRALSIVQTWTRSDDEHVRRLATEGTRPYLPWSTRVPGIQSSPSLTIPILDALYRDESDYVRRSVANHLNDHSRFNASLVVETAARWLDAPDPTTAALVKHALRTLVKRGDLGALELLGFGAATLDVTGPALSLEEVPLGGTITFTGSIRNTGTAAAKLAIDYTVHHQKANGTQTGKTFKLASQTLAPGDSLDLVKQHSFRAITTRRYYPDAHAIELQINGVVYGRAEFELLGE